jgi:hypothetical protein
MFSNWTDIPVDEKGTSYGDLIRQKYPYIGDLDHVYHAGNSSGPQQFCWPRSATRRRLGSPLDREKVNVNGGSRRAIAREIAETWAGESACPIRVDLHYWMPSRLDVSSGPPSRISLLLLRGYTLCWSFDLDGALELRQGPFPVQAHH